MLDFSHVLEFPPQPSTVLGIACVVGAGAVIIASAGAGIEIAGPLAAIGMALIAVPDNTSTSYRKPPE